MKFFFTYTLLIIFAWNSFQPQFHVKCSPVEKKDSCCSTPNKKKSTSEEKCHSEEANDNSVCSQCVHKVSISIMYFQMAESYQLQKPNNFISSIKKFCYQLGALPHTESSIWQPPKINQI